jgi:RHS repeat-associated protein
MNTRIVRRIATGKIVTQLCLAVVLALMVCGSALAQSPQTGARPDRGANPGGAYAVSDIESVNLQNGNVSLAIPLASLPPIAGGKLSWTISAHYNSKLWDVARKEESVFGVVMGYRTYVVDKPQQSDRGGWSVGGGYRVIFRDAKDDFDYAVPPYSQDIHNEWHRLTDHNWKKVILITPDGAEHELRPSDSVTPYFGIDMPRDYLNMYYPDIDQATTPRRYHSLDGTYLSVLINPAASADPESWTIFSPDGTRVIQYKSGIQRIKDANGNSIKIYEADGATHYQDEQTGRELKITSNNTNGTMQYQVWYQTVEGTWMHVDVNFGSTIVQGKVYSVDSWNTSVQGESGEEGIACRKQQVLQDTLMVVRSIVFPQTEPGVAGRQFTFDYNSDTTETATTNGVRWDCGGQPENYTRTVSSGLGELSRMVTPSGAIVDYTYSNDGVHSFMSMLTEDKISGSVLTTKKLTHDGTVDQWTYDIPINGLASNSAVTNPDGSETREFYYPTDPRFNQIMSGSGSEGLGGLVYRTTQSGQITERRWAMLYPSGQGQQGTGMPAEVLVSANPVVAAEYTTVAGANGGPSKTNAKLFTHDANDNVTQVTEYDWFNPADLSRDGYGVPTGVPTNATVLRVTNTSYHNSVDDSASNLYFSRTLVSATPLFLNLPKETSVGTSVTRFSYDGQSYGTAPTLGNVTTVSRFDNRGDSNAGNDVWVSTSSTYDSYGNVATATDANGNTTQIFYEDATHVMPTRVVVDPQNGTGTQTSATSYDFSTGAVLTQTDPNGSLSTIDYTNQLLGTIDPFARPGAVYSPAVVINGNSKRHKTTTTYHERTIAHPQSALVASDLNAEGDGLLKSETLYDDLGRSVESRQYETSTTYVTIKQTYDSMGRVSQVSSPYRSGDSVLWTTTGYDLLGRVLTVTTPDNAVVSTAYSANQTTVTDQAGKVRRSVMDGLGRLVRVDEPDANNSLGSVDSPSQPTSYTYDVLGNLTQVNQGSQTRRFTYSSLSRLTSASNPEASNQQGVQIPITYQYDANGNLTQKTDARGVTTTYVYDALNRPTSRSYSDSTPTVTYAYDTAGVSNSKGRLISVSSSVSNTSYSGYDAMGRVTASSQTTDGQTYAMSYGYNLAGAITSETYPSGRIITTGYDDAGRLNQVNGQKTGETNKTYASSVSYTAHGAISEMKLGNNLWEHTIFNNRLQPVLIGLGTSQSIPNPQDFNRCRVDYSYGTTNNNGNVLQQTISVPDTSGTYIAQMSQYYEYDALNRLKSATEISGGTESWKQTFVYDRFGNRTFDVSTDELGHKKTSDNALSSQLTIDSATNRFTAGQGSILYDNAGNLTREFNGHTFSYDGENKQITYDGGATTGGGASYSYDGDGKRVKKITGLSMETTIFVYDAAGQMVAEYSSASQQGSGGTSYLTSDNLGTPRVITDSIGAVNARHDYMPFGEEIGLLGGRTTGQGYVADNVRRKFTQKERDVESGLDYFHARYYSSAHGRFNSPDQPFADQWVSAPQSWNLYSYVLNTPLKFTDPNGRGHWELRDDGQEHYVGDKIGEFSKDLDAKWDGAKWNFRDIYGQDNNIYPTVLISDPPRSRAADSAIKLLPGLAATAGGVGATAAIVNVINGTLLFAGADAVVPGVVARDLQGNVIYQGDVDLQATYLRISQGFPDAHYNDGATYRNDNEFLPLRPEGYYTEWVVRTPGYGKVGPMRIVTGDGGEVWFTPDHYEKTFIPMNDAARNCGCGPSATGP